MRDLKPGISEISEISIYRFSRLLRMLCSGGSKNSFGSMKNMPRTWISRRPSSLQRRRISLRPDQFGYRARYFTAKSTSRGQRLEAGFSTFQFLRASSPIFDTCKAGTAGENRYPCPNSQPRPRSSSSCSSVSIPSANTVISSA